MASKRLNDTAAIASMPVMGGGDTSMSMDVRKIENGYVTRTSTYGDGTYRCKETYSPAKPGMSEPGGASNSMKAATDYLNRK